ncbi:MAG: hypothetical protein GX541_02640, partial [Clostridiales bacterium]|nr:hypothetical protein [Clostridiales bacterium]
MFRLNCSRFYNYEEMKTWLEGMAKEHPDKMRLETLTETPEGRAVHVVTLADFSLGDEAEKRSAYFVKAGVHAQETAGTTAAMAVIERVLEKTPEVLKDIVFYVIPRVNPDGTELAISKSFRMIRSKLGFIDGLANALIPQDINGDGKILQMRRKNPAGNMKEHPECPGLMVPRKPCDKDCDFYDVWCEGVIENYDGGEPVPGFEHVDFNR